MNCTTESPWILGISASHNGAACLLRGNEIICSVQEERLTRNKRDRIDGASASLSVNYCLEVAGIGISDLDLVAVCTQERAEDQRHDWYLNPQLNLARLNVPLLRLSHHLGHAACALALSGEERAAVLVVDGAGSPYGDLSPDEQSVFRNPPGTESISMYIAEQGVLTPIEKQGSGANDWLDQSRHGMPRFSTLGGMYSAAAAQIFGDPLEAGKVMGLAPLGQPTIPVSDFLTICDGVLVFHDGIADRFGHAERWPAHRQAYADLASSVQQALESALLALCERLRARTDCAALCYAGGVALNGIANDRIAREAGFSRLYIPAAAEDSGTAIGAAFHGLWQMRGFQPRRRVEHDSTGRAYRATQIDAAIRSTPFINVHAHQDDSLCDEIADRLEKRQLGGWFEGGSELGPRALGHRSIIADARHADAKAELNGRVKRREDFRPFAPAILEEKADQWFDCGPDPKNPFMLRIWKFREGCGEQVPAVMHQDGSGRAQTVSAETSPRFHALLRKFEARTGVPILLNTSFNGRGEPIVETPEDALWCLLENGLDFLFLEGRLVTPSHALSDLLGLVPKLLVTSFRPTRTFVDGVWHSGKIDCEVSTPWGQARQRIGPDIWPLIEAIDGKRTGYEIHDLIRRHDGQSHPVTTIRLLAFLRRKRVLCFNHSGPAQPNS